MLILFVVPHLSTSGAAKEQAIINAYQPSYEQIIHHTLQTIDQSGITSLALPVLEPSGRPFHCVSLRSSDRSRGSVLVKLPSERRTANEMTVRAMVSAFRLFSQNPAIKLKRIVVVDHQAQIKRMSKRVKQYQRRVETTPSQHQRHSVDFDTDDGQSFASIFGVRRASKTIASADESDEDADAEEYQLPYTDHARS